MTLARMLRISLALQMAAGALLGTLLAAGWLPGTAARWLAAAAGAAAVPVLLTAGALGAELIVDAIADPRQPPRGLANALRVWLGETGASLRAFCIRQPFGADFPEPRIVHDKDRPALLLIHGYVCNRAAWRPLLEAGALARCNVATVDLLPVYASIDDYAPLIDTAVERLRAASGAPAVVLVAHSMGGLAARAYLRRFGAAAVARVITIATPHAGTRFAPLGNGPNARQMRPGSDWLRALDAALTPALRARFLSIAGTDDNLILPRASALLAGARHASIDGVGHVAALEDRRVWGIIATEAQAAARGRERPAPEDRGVSGGEAGAQAALERIAKDR